MAAISFVASTGGTADSTSSFTIFKPSGVASGDFMLALLSFYAGSGGSQRTVTAPAGWTKVGEKYVTANSAPHQICALSRTAGGSEPGSWSGSISGSAVALAGTVTVAYRNVIGLATSGVTSKGVATSYSTATVNNPTATNWRVTMAGYTSGSVAYDLLSNEVSLRKRNWRESSVQDMELAAWDSNGTIATGNTSRTVSRGGNWNTSCSWIGVLDANDVTITGSFAATLPLLTMTSAANLNYSGTMAASLPLLTMTGDGIASPPEGSLAATITPVMSVAGAHHAAGTLDALLTPIVEVVGETRKFGIRVVTPEAESRVTTPRLGAVD